MITRQTIVRYCAGTLTALALAVTATMTTTATASAAPTDAVAAAGTAFVAGGGSAACRHGKEDGNRIDSAADQVPRGPADLYAAKLAVINLINAERRGQNLRRVCSTTRLTTAAQEHALNWNGAERGCPDSNNGSGWVWYGCAHWDSRPGLAWPQDRVAASGFGMCAVNCVGENTQNGGGVSDGRGIPAGMVWGTPRAAVWWWMNHDGGKNGHRDAILRGDWSYLGVGVATYTDQWGNQAAAYVVDFAKA